MTPSPVDPPKDGNEPRRLADCLGKVRLIEGAYDPSESVVYTEKVQVNEACREDLGFIFRGFEDGVAVGSHDPEMRTLATDLHARYGSPTRSGC